MAQIRENLEDIRKRMPRGATSIPAPIMADVSALRQVVHRNAEYLDESDFEMLSTGVTSTAQDRWAAELHNEWESKRTRKQEPDPWATGGQGSFSDEPPF
jgi:hypothetical protein